MKSDQLVTVISFFYPHETGIPRSLLESEGIECFVHDENIISVHPFYSNAIGGVRLQVRESDAQRAIEILREGGFINEAGKKTDLDEETTKAKPFNGSTCPYCGSNEVVRRKKIAGKSSILASIFLLSFCSIPFLFYRRKYHCMDCGKDFKKNDN